MHYDARDAGWGADRATKKNVPPALGAGATDDGESGEGVSDIGRSLAVAGRLPGPVEPCAACRAEAEMLTTSAAARLARVSPQMICGRAAVALIRLVTLPRGVRLVCRDSLALVA
jgi:hypothetical protein